MLLDLLETLLKTQKAFGFWVLWRFHYPSVFLPRKLLQRLGVEIDFFGFNIQSVLLSSHHSLSIWMLLGDNYEETYEEVSTTEVTDQGSNNVDNRVGIPFTRDILLGKIIVEWKDDLTM
ncbi:hypothetical protein Peur_001889 [Populus x canadensis]